MHQTLADVRIPVVGVGCVIERRAWDSASASLLVPRCEPSAPRHPTPFSTSEHVLRAFPDRAEGVGFEPTKPGLPT